jgi:hypothetical protein
MYSTTSDVSCLVNTQNVGSFCMRYWLKKLWLNESHIPPRRDNLFLGNAEFFQLKGMHGKVGWLNPNLTRTLQIQETRKGHDYKTPTLEKLLLPSPKKKAHKTIMTETATQFSTVPRSWNCPSNKIQSECRSLKANWLQDAQVENTCLNKTHKKAGTKGSATSNLNFWLNTPNIDGFCMRHWLKKALVKHLSPAV